MKRPNHIDEAILTLQSRSQSIELETLIDFMESRERTTNEAIGKLGALTKIHEADTMAYRAERARCRVVHGGKVS